MKLGIEKRIMLAVQKGKVVKTVGIEQINGEVVSHGKSSQKGESNILEY